MIKLLHMDCMEYMTGCEDNAFELAITDPPYGIGAAEKPVSMGSWKRDIHKSKKWDSEKPNSEYFTELFRVSNNVIIWGGNYFIDNLMPSRCWIVWDKNNGSNDMADCELAWTSFDSSVRKFTRSHINDFNDRVSRIHPTQKPVQLYAFLMKNYAKEGDRILDTHLGSGSSAIAAHYGGFDFVGMELDEDYYNAACIRFDQETAQQAMDI